jgi:uncharacterized protein (DUF885 family)
MHRLLALAVALGLALSAARAAPDTPRAGEAPRPDGQAGGQGASPAGVPRGSGGAPPPAIDFGKSLDDIIAAKGRLSESERQRALFEQFWIDTLQENPELGTYLGIPGTNDRWQDLSPQALARRKALRPKLLAAVESIDRAALSAAGRLDHDLFLRLAREDVEGGRFPSELLAIDQLHGVQHQVPQVLAAMPARGVQDYEDMLARLRGVPRLIDQNVALLDQGLAAGVTPPRVTLRDVPAQVGGLLVDPPLASPVLAPFAEFPAAVSAAQQERLRRQAVEVFATQVAPAFRRLRRYLETTYLPGARESIAMSALPDGEAWYAYRVRQHTTTDATPRQLHELGKAEVRRLRKQMDELIAGIGWKGSFADFLHFLRSDPRFFFDRPSDLLIAYRDICKRIDPQLVKLFGKLPRLPYGVQPIPAYAEQTALAGYYDLGSLADGRPGIFYVNTYDPKARPKWAMEDLALHEAVPGHHLQIALAQELEDVPQWRRLVSYTAFVEGWGLYAEGLGAEIGMYQDPYSRFGEITSEAWRAIRLVVDTGIHSLGWSRQQALDYCRENAAKTEREITTEVDRYIAIPAQALAYKVGELKIRQLRSLAEKELGPRFELRAFHDQLLARGALPLDVLEAEIKNWLVERKAAAATGSPATHGPSGMLVAQ